MPKTKASDAAVETKAEKKPVSGFNLEAAVEDYATHTVMQQNGIRHADKALMTRRLTDVHGIDMKEVQKYHEAMIDERSALTVVTGNDTAAAVTAARADGGTPEAISAITASTSFWRHDGEETLTCIAEDTSGDSTIDEGGNVVPVVKHGRIRTSISGHDGVRRKTLDDVSALISGLFA